MTTSRFPPRSSGRVVWGSLWRTSLILLIGCLAIPLIHGEAMRTVDPDGPGAPAVIVRLLLDVLLGLGAMVLYQFRRRAPLAIIVAIISISSISSLATGAVVLGIVSVATRRRWQEIGIIAVAFPASLIVGEFYFPGPEPMPWWQFLMVVGVLLVLLVVTGMYIGGRRQLRRTIAEKAESNRREHAALLEQARVSERARIAREMHDVLAHRLSLVALHAGVLECRADLPPELQRTTAGIVRENAHLALTELREVLGVLREPDSAGETQATRPQPTLANLADLLVDSATAGTPATLDLAPTAAGGLDGLTDAASRNLYRIIQEGLTNARKHAPGQAVTVRIGGEPGSRLTLSLANEVPGPDRVPSMGSPESGLGLTGLRERVRLAGGQLTAGADGRGRFALEAWLPWT